jgi:hypothetical protein
LLLYGPCLVYSTGSPSAFDLGASSCCACLLHDDYTKETIHRKDNEFAIALYDWYKRDKCDWWCAPFKLCYARNKIPASRQNAKEAEEQETNIDFVWSTKNIDDVFSTLRNHNHCIDDLIVFEAAIDHLLSFISEQGVAAIHVDDNKNVVDILLYSIHCHSNTLSKSILELLQWNDCQFAIAIQTIYG